MELNPAWTAALEHSAHEFLLWVGFGTVVGLTAKAIMPGRDPGGAIGTLVMGVVGSVMGCGTVSFFFKGVKVSPITSWGFVASTAGAFTLLLCYRMFAGSFIRETEDRWLSAEPRRRSKKDGTITHEVWREKSRRAG